MSDGPGGDRARTLLALLQPALAAGVATVHRADRAALRLAEAVGGTGVAAWLYDEAGGLLHASAAAAALAAAGRAHADRLATDVLAAVRSGRPATAERLAPLDGAPTRFQASVVEPGSRRAAAVVVTAAEAEPPSAARLRERFALTPRQAEVAGLLAQRLTNPEIAEALFISPHTARHHTEAVLRKLDVTDRRDVAAALLGE